MVYVASPKASNLVDSIPTQKIPAPSFLDAGFFCQRDKVSAKMKMDFVSRYRLSSIRLSTTVAEISRLAASGMTMEVGASMTSSVTIMLRRTGRQCMKKP